MARAVSAPVKAGMLAQATEEGLITLLEITHADLPAPVRLSTDRVDTVSNGATWIAFPFELVLPDEQEGRPPAGELRIANVSREITLWLRQLGSAPDCTIRLVRLDDPETVEAEFAGLRFQEPQWSSTEPDIRIRLESAGRGAGRFPAGRFDPSGFPGLF